MHFANGLWFAIVFSQNRAATTRVNFVTSCGSRSACASLFRHLPPFGAVVSLIVNTSLECWCGAVVLSWVVVVFVIGVVFRRGTFKSQKHYKSMEHSRPKKVPASFFSMFSFLFGSTTSESTKYKHSTAYYAKLIQCFPYSHLPDGGGQARR